MSKNPIETLQENATSFFEKVNQKYSDVMVCKKGCSKCCQTDISVFEVESSRIEEWFGHLSAEKKDGLLTLWKTPHQESFCTFLYEDQCTVYEARPLICRTQGLPLFLASQNSLDYCPLNFTNENPPKEDWLNLERMNTLLSLAAKSAGKENRVTLKKLKKKLLENN